MYALISRRSRYRVGTRYFSRGVDAEGNVSNFVETEQIVMADPAEEVNPEVSSNGRFNAAVQGKLRMSYVQTRGSIPIFWAQITNLKYAPTLQAIQTPQTVRRARESVITISEIEFAYVERFCVSSRRLHFVAIYKANFTSTGRKL